MNAADAAHAAHAANEASAATAVNEADAEATGPLTVETPPPAHLLYYAAALARHLDLTPAADPGGWTDPFSLPSGWRLGGTPAWTTHRLRTPGQDPVSVRIRSITAGNVADATDNPAELTREVEPGSTPATSTAPARP